MLIDQKNIIHASAEYGKTVNVNFMHCPENSRTFKSHLP